MRTRRECWNGIAGSYKHFHTYLNQNLGAGQFVWCINPMERGYTEENRVGDTVYMGNVQLRCLTEPVTVQDNGFLRLMIVYDRQPNGTLATIWPDILQLPYIIVSDYNRDTTGRFEILWDRTDLINGSGSRNGGDSTMTWNSPFVGIENSAVYQGNAGDYTDLKTGSLLFCAFATVTTHLEAETVVFYKDI